MNRPDERSAGYRTSQTVRSPMRSGGPSGPRRSAGCGTYVLLGFLALLLIGALLARAPESKTPTTSTPVSVTSTVTRARERLSSSLCIESGSWYQDDWGDWIDDDSESDRRILLNSLRSFYTATGVQPFLWITGSEGAGITGTAALEDAAVRKYDSLFSDQGHLVFIFREYPNASGNYLSGCYAGTDAETVIDADAREILLSAVDRYYDDEDLSDSRMFANAFSDAAAEIMRSSAVQTAKQTAGSEKQDSAYFNIGRVFVILLVVGVGFVVIRRLKKKNAQDTAASAAASSSAAQTVTAPAAQDTAQASPEPAPVEYTAVKCPYCGAQTKVPRSGEGLCEYCGMKVSDE